MPKSKSKSGKAAKSTGAKASKSVRSSGSKLMDALSHPLIADVAAAALVAAAAALRGDDRVGKAAGKAGRAAADAGGDAASIGSKLVATAVDEVRRLGVAGLAEAVAGKKGKAKKGGRRK